MIDPHDRPRFGDDTLAVRGPCRGDVDARFALGRTPGILQMFGGDPDTVQPLTPVEAEDGGEARMQTPRAFAMEFEGRGVDALRLYSLDPHDRCGLFATGRQDPSLLGRTRQAARGADTYHGDFIMGVQAPEWQA